MKKSRIISYIISGLSILTISLNLTGCKKSNPIKFPMGTFPDSIKALTDINSSSDDINTDLYELNGNKVLIFSSNRNNNQFDLIQGSISYTWDQTNGAYTMNSEITNDAFLTKLLTSANTTLNDYGPYSLYSPADGYEYLILASDNGIGNIDFNYLKNRPVSGSTLPDVLGPYPITWLNTSADDAYMCFNTKQDSLYYSSATGGNFDIYQKTISPDTSLTNYFSRTYRPGIKVDSINSSGNDKCPYVFRKFMVFASDRPGGMGGYDLYYSVFKNGKWNSPVNFGPKINTQYNEYRPVIGYNNSFTNNFMIFSSDRPGGKGGYDLYIKGITIPK